MKSLTTRLLAMILAITLLGMGLLTVIQSILTDVALLEESMGRIGETTALNAGNIDAWLGRHVGYIESIAAGFSSARDASPEAFLPELIRHCDLNDDYFSVYIGYPNGIGIFSDGWEPDYNEWRANERGWYKGAAAAPGQVFISELYQDANTLEFCLTLSKVITHNGNMHGVIAIDIFTTVLNDVVKKVSVGQDSYALLTDPNGDIYVHHNSSYTPVADKDGDTVFKNIATIEDGRYADLRRSSMLYGDTVNIRGVDGTKRFYAAHTVDLTGWILYTSIPERVVYGPIYHQITVSVLILAAVLIAASLLIYYTLRSMIIVPVRDVTSAANLLAQGETGVKLDGRYIGEIAQLAESFKGMEEFNRQQTEWLESIASGDLTVEAQRRGTNDRIGQAIVSMLGRLNEMFNNIRLSTHQVANGSKQIADGAQSLAEGSTQQASVIEELSSSVVEISDKAKESADMARRASLLANTIKDSAEKGSRQMDDMIAAVGEISAASQSISNVIKTIDDIAFQTNILALNAAVEAARAGTAGKGFAVVAEEVRNLATKSADAAKDTESLIENSIEKAKLGVQIAGETAGSLTEIVTGITESSQLTAVIARYSEEQSADIMQINAGIDQVVQVVQHNSATAQESAAASEEMSGQSSILERMVSQFKLK